MMRATATFATEGASDRMLGETDYRWRGPRLRLLGVAAALAALPLLLTSCGGDEDSPVSAKPTPKVTVVAGEEGYDPALVKIEPGTRVTWVSNSDNGVTVETLGVGFFDFDRTRHDRLNIFDLHTLNAGEAESVEFDTPGRYQYHSSYDSSKKGVVEVTEEEG
jgi:plastocyanin